MDLLNKGSYGKIYNFNEESIIKKTRFLDIDGIINCNVREVCFYAYVKNRFNIVEFIDLSIHDSIFSIVLKKMKTDLHEYIFYTDIHTRINKFNSIFFNVVKSIYYMHKNGMVHGDIKPLNILLDENEEVGYLCDFGSVQFEKETMFTNKTTVKYCPDIIDEYYPVSQSNDIYSLGFTMIHYIYGDTMIKIDNKCKTNIRKMLEYISKNYSPSLSILLSSMIKENSNDRISIESVIRFFTDSEIGIVIISIPETQYKNSENDISIFLQYIFGIEFFSIYRTIDLSIYIYSKYTSIKKINGDMNIFKICSYLSTNIICDFSELSDYSLEYDKDTKDYIHDIFSTLKFDLYRPTIFSRLVDYGISIQSKQEIETFQNHIRDNIRNLDYNNILKCYTRIL